MKKIFTLLLLVASFSSFSQTSLLGVQAGLGISWNIHLYPGYQNRCFGHQSIGIRFIRATRSPFTYGIALDYSLEGAKLHAQWEQPFLNSIDLKARLQYLRLNLNGGYFFGKPSSTVRVLALAGPSIGYLLKGYETYEITHPAGTEHFEQNTTLIYNHRVDVGIQGGVGLHIGLSPKTTLSTDVTYYHGFMNTWDANRKNSNAALNVGVLWKVGGKKRNLVSNR